MNGLELYDRLRLLRDAAADRKDEDVPRASALGVGPGRIGPWWKEVVHDEPEGPH